MQTVEGLPERNGGMHSSLGKVVTALDGPQGHQDQWKSTGGCQVGVTYLASTPEGAGTGSDSWI